MLPLPLTYTYVCVWYLLRSISALQSVEPLALKGVAHDAYNKPPTGDLFRSVREIDTDATSGV